MRRTIFCPSCGSRLEKRDREGRSRLYCAAEDSFVYENPLPAVTAAVRSENGDILLVRRKIEPGKGRWALPGGFIELQESPVDAARRELMEECGIQVSGPSLIDILYQESRFYGTSILIIGYSFDGFEGNPAAGDDASEIGFFDPKKPPKLAFEAHRRMIEHFLLRLEERKRLWTEEV